MTTIVALVVGPNELFASPHFLATPSLLFPQVCGVVVRCLENGLGAFCSLYLEVKSSDIAFLIDLIKMEYLPLLLKLNKHIYIYIYKI